MLRVPELDAGLPVGSHQSRSEGQNPLLHPAAHAAGDAAQGTVAFLGCKRTLLGHIELLVIQHPQVPLGRSALNPLVLQPVLILGVAPAQVQDLMKFT